MKLTKTILILLILVGILYLFNYKTNNEKMKIGDEKALEKTLYMTNSEEMTTVQEDSVKKLPITSNIVKKTSIKNRHSIGNNW